jgi:sugar O-acyltransferase (sialic acid O-acetyltransferase NeuD family)
VSTAPLLLIGAGGHALACIDVIERTASFEIVGLIGAAAEKGASVLGYPVIGTDADLEHLAARCPNALICVGQLESPGRRIALFEALNAAGYRLPAIVSPSAEVSRHATIGPGTIVMHGAIVNAGARIGANCIVNTRALVEHGAVVGDHCHISTGAIANGDVKIGEGTFIGSGSVIREGITIGRDCFVGMGHSVSKNLPDGTRFVERAK